MTAATNGGSSSGYTYDGDGNRLSQTTGTDRTNLTWDVNAPVPQLAAETDGVGALLRRYTYGVDRISMTTPSTTGFYSTDMLGTVTEISNNNGISLGQFDTRPFGDDPSSTGVDPSIAANPFGFAGEYRDPGTGLYDLHARQYDSTTGRFLSPDPLGAEGGSSSYVYVGDSPLSFTDPTGMRRITTTTVSPFTACGRYGHSSCFGLEGDASDPLWSTRSTIINLALLFLPGGDVARAVRLVEDAAEEGTAAATATGAARSASTPFGRLVQSLRGGDDGWRLTSAHAEPATSGVYKGGTSVEEVFERGTDRLVRHRIYDSRGNIVHETFRPHAKFGAP